jgi:hypothetical protein
MILSLSPFFLNFITDWSGGEPLARVRSPPWHGDLTKFVWQLIRY